MTKGGTLQDRLALSLDQANVREAKSHRQAPAPLPADRRCTKLSVSLFSGDVARLDAIRSYMAQRGVMISTSQAIKLALRTAPLTPDMDKALDAIRSEDGRKW
jgi:hypothetical protein